MRLDPSDIADLRPLLVEVVRATLVEVQAFDAKLGSRIAYTESEAAALLGTKPHVLADARRRGEISGFKVGLKMHYSRGELLRFAQEK